jgi:hypothetical protein
LIWLLNGKRIKQLQQGFKRGIMTDKGLSTTVQESKGKYTTPIPMGLINLLGIKKSDTFIWNLDNGKISITVVKA